MQIIFNIPDEYINEIKIVFKVDSKESFRNKIINIVKNTVKLYREDKAIKEIRENITIESDIIS